MNGIRFSWIIDGHVQMLLFAADTKVFVWKHIQNNHILFNQQAITQCARKQLFSWRTELEICLYPFIVTCHCQSLQMASKYILICDYMTSITWVLLVSLYGIWGAITPLGLFWCSYYWMWWKHMLGVCSGYVCCHSHQSRGSILHHYKYTFQSHHEDKSETNNHWVIYSLALRDGKMWQFGKACLGGRDTKSFNGYDIYSGHT